MAKFRITAFHPNIQAAIRFLGGSTTLQQIADEEKVTKQAIHKRVQEGIEYIERYQKEDTFVPKSELDFALKEQERLDNLAQHLRRELIISGVQRQLLQYHKSKVLEFLSHFKIGRLPGVQKKTNP